MTVQGLHPGDYLVWVTGKNERAHSGGHVPGSDRPLECDSPPRSHRGGARIWVTGEDDRVVLDAACPSRPERAGRLHLSVGAMPRTCPPSSSPTAPSRSAPSSSSSGASTARPTLREVTTHRARSASHHPGLQGAPTRIVITVDENTQNCNLRRRRPSRPTPRRCAPTSTTSSTRSSAQAKRSDRLLAHAAFKDKTVSSSRTARAAWSRSRWCRRTSSSSR